jgi:hypothetical protein
MNNNCTRTRGFLVSIVLTSYNAKHNHLNRCGDYLEESGEPERSVASRIGIPGDQDVTVL